jgi:hypothetical protein
MQYHACGLNPIQIAKRVHVSEERVRRTLEAAGVVPVEDTKKGAEQVSHSESHWNGWLRLIAESDTAEQACEFAEKASRQVDEALDPGPAREQIRSRVLLAAWKKYQGAVHEHEREERVLALQEEHGEKWAEVWRSEHPKPPTIAGETLTQRPAQYVDEVVPGSSEPKPEVDAEKERRILQLAEERYGGDARLAAEALMKRGEVTI